MLNSRFLICWSFHLSMACHYSLFLRNYESALYFSHEPFINSVRHMNSNQYFLKAGREKGPWKQGWAFIPVKASKHNSWYDVSFETFWLESDPRYMSECKSEIYHLKKRCVKPLKIVKNSPRRAPEKTS